MKINKYHKKRNEKLLKKLKNNQKLLQLSKKLQNNSKESGRAESTRTTHNKDF